jgi:hypothetical protein
VLAAPATPDAAPRLRDPDGPIGLALAHDLLVTVGRTSPDQRSTRAFALRPARGVVVVPEPGAGGMARLTTFAAGELVTRILAAVSDGPLAPDGDGSADAEFDAATLGAALADTGAPLEALGPMADAIRSWRATAVIRITRREGDRVAGTELRILDSGAGGCWLLEPASPTDGWSRLRARRHDRDELVAALLACLPGQDLHEAHDQQRSQP